MVTRRERGSAEDTQVAVSRSEAASTYRQAARRVATSEADLYIALAGANSAMAELVRLDVARGLVQSHGGNTVELSTGSITEILKMYGKRGFQSAGSMVRDKLYPNRNYEITTSEGGFFLKQYARFTMQKREGLFLAEYLAERSYPSTKVLRAKEDGVPWVIYKGSAFALFELVDFPKNGSLSGKDAAEAGRALAEFHRLSANFLVLENEIDSSWKMASRNFDELYKRINQFSPRQKIALHFLNESIGKIVPREFEVEEVPSGVCHTEFNPNEPYRHVAFVNRQTVFVGDFDTIERGRLLNDLGMLMLAAVVPKNGGGSAEYKIDFGVMGKVVDGYAKGRLESGKPLTEYEQTHMYEALLRAAFSHIAWRGALVQDYECFGMAAALRDIGKEEFNKRLGEARVGVKPRE